jgi:arylsulfatase
MRRLAGWLAGLGCALGAACGSEEPDARDVAAPATPPPAAGVLAAPPTIVLITIDTLRREHLGCYGYFRPTSPRIDALAAEGLLFERAVASMASTLPSHLTLLTGLYPHQHGMTSNRRGASVSFVSELGRQSLAEVLRRGGYRTAAFVSATPLAPTTGVNAGFETFEAPHNSARGSSPRADERNEAVLAWLEREALKPGPFFLWVHYFDPHEPNDPEAPYDTLFPSDEAQLAWIRARGIDPAALEARFSDSSRIGNHFIPPERAAKGRKPRGPPPITLQRVADLMNRYDGEVRATDDQVGALLDALRRTGRYDEALIVLAADHGQSLGEDDWFGHGSITDVNTLVPLIVRLPGRMLPPQRLPQLVSLADVAPTVCARFELPDSATFVGQFEGEDVLSGHFARDTALAARTADELQDGETGRQFALHSGRWKYVHRVGGRDELVDLASGDGADVLARRPEVGARLRAETLALLARRPALLADDPDLPVGDPELLRSLEDLGYGGGDDEDEGESE